MKAKNIDWTFVEIQGFKTKIDIEDLPLIDGFKWRVMEGRSHNRFVRYVYFAANVSGKLVKLHRHLAKAPKGKCVDHINRDTLDNRKSNLRITTLSENQINSKNRERKLPRNVYMNFGTFRVEFRRNHKKVIDKTFKTLKEAEKFANESRQALAKFRGGK